jgi:hypothetical protein
VAANGAPPRDGYGYPLFRRNDRALPPDWSGPLYVWDIDNTYLVTEWSGLRDLIRIRFEAAEDKRPVPGAVELLTALRRGTDPDSRPPVFFVSASPETMRPVLEKRMLIDGVVQDGITFRNLNRLRYLRDIFGYKVSALLLYRLENPPTARETLFGDDREHDPEVYALYARVCAGTLRGDALREYLATRNVGRSAARYIETLASELPERDPVEWIFIRRIAPGTPPAALRLEDDRIVLIDDFSQAAAVLRAQGRLEHEDLLRVVAAVRAAGRGQAPAAALDTPAVRARVSEEALARTRQELAAATPAEVAAAAADDPQAPGTALVEREAIEASATIASEAAAGLSQPPQPTDEEEEETR